MKNVLIGVIIPSQGFIFAETLQSINNNLKNKQFKMFISWDLETPFAQNELTEKALNAKCDYLWFVKEDIVVPDGTLDKMLKISKPIVCVDYPIADARSTVWRVNKSIIFCGLGCTLIKRTVFGKIRRPWFRTDKVLYILNTSPFEAEWRDEVSQFGGEDVWFFNMCYLKGIKMYQLPKVICTHLEIEGQEERYNFGLYQIKRQNEIKILNNFQAKGNWLSHQYLGTTDKEKIARAYA